MIYGLCFGGDGSQAPRLTSIPKTGAQAPPKRSLNCTHACMHACVLVYVKRAEVMWVWPPMRKFLFWAKCRTWVVNLDIKIFNLSEVLREFARYQWRLNATLQFMPPMTWYPPVPHWQGEGCSDTWPYTIAKKGGRPNVDVWTAPISPPSSATLGLGWVLFCELL